MPPLSPPPPRFSPFKAYLLTKTRTVGTNKKQLNEMIDMHNNGLNWLI